jgi:hypothetical protein
MASVSARNSTSLACRAPIAAENSPLSERSAERAASRLAASMRSATASFEEGAPRELPGFGDARAGIQAGREQRLHHHRSAVSLQFEHWLAGIGMRRRKVQREAFVDGIAVPVAERAEGGEPWLGQAAEDGGGDTRHRRPGNADYPDAPAPCWGGNRRDRVAGGVIAWHGQACRD